MAVTMFSSHASVWLVQTFSTSHFLNVLLDESWSLNCSQSWGVTRHAAWRGPSRFAIVFGLITSLLTCCVWISTRPPQILQCGEQQAQTCYCSFAKHTETVCLFWGFTVLLQWLTVTRTLSYILPHMWRWSNQIYKTVALLLLLLESKRASERAWPKTPN